jgi:stearoyl-CoA desaturase (Delta-9 desaturase)
MLYFLLWFFVGSFLLAIPPNRMAVNGTTVYLHRQLVHRALQLHWSLELMYRFGLWLTTGIVRAVWEAIHRKHHAFADEEGDPHSPYIAGFWPIQFGNVFRYIEAKETPGLIADWSYTKQDRLDRWLFNRGWLGLLIGIIMLVCISAYLNRSGWWLDAGNVWLNYLTGSLMGLTAALIHAFTYVFLQSSSVNGLCHYPHRLGYQRWVKRTATTFNNVLVAMGTDGEGFHHNHHAFQTSARFAMTKLEVLIDFGWWTIWIYKQLRLAKNVKVTPLTVR